MSFPVGSPDALACRFQTSLRSQKTGSVEGSLPSS
jgi:hypothetical protein